MYVKKEVMEAFVRNFNTNYLTIGEMSKKLGYSSHTALIKKVRKLKLGYRIKTVHLLSKEDQKILKENIQRRDSRDFKI